MTVVRLVFLCVKVTMFQLVDVVVVVMVVLVGTVTCTAQPTDRHVAQPSLNLSLCMPYFQINTFHYYQSRQLKAVIGNYQQTTKLQSSGKN